MANRVKLFIISALSGVLAMVLSACVTVVTPEPLPAATQAPVTVQVPAATEETSDTTEEAVDTTEEAAAATGETSDTTEEAADTTEETSDTTEEAADAAEFPAIELDGDPIRGGLLYDMWWPVMGMDKPRVRSPEPPLWTTQTTNTRSGDATWRCKECHGWDYKGAEGTYGPHSSHFTGFVGVLGAVSKGSGYVYAALTGEINSDHNFTRTIDDQGLADLTLFIVELTIDYDQFVGEDKLAVGGDPAIGEELFQNTCTGCHGVEGTAINFKSDSGPEYLGTVSLDVPWEFLHKMRVGQPTEQTMPSAIDNGWTKEEQLSLLAYVQTLPAASPVTEGGRLYAKWWEAMGVDEPGEDQPLWATQSTNIRSGAATWSCSECHGWDYKGADGVYGSGSHATGFPGILDASVKSTEELAGWFDGTANPDHDFTTYLGEDQINMLAAFVQEGLFDMSELVNDDKTINGDPDHGKELYEAGCERCHGEEGLDRETIIGGLSKSNPWRVLHKASTGQPGKNMPAGLNYGWSVQDRADLVSYVQTLPTSAE